MTEVSPALFARGSARSAGVRISSAAAPANVAAIVVALTIAASIAASHLGAQTFRSSVNLVIVPVSVSDPAGQYVGDLTQSDFVVYEDGRERPIEDFSSERIPVSLGTLIDISGSMAGQRFADAQEAMSKLWARMTPDDRVFLATFNERFQLVAPWTNDRGALSRAIAGVKPSGGTFLYRAIASALPLLDDQVNRKKALVLISDGDDNEKPGGIVNREGLAQAVAQAIRSDAVIYAVAIGRPKPPLEEMIRQMTDPEARRQNLYDPPIDVDQLRRLTDPTGGYSQIIAASSALPATVIRVVDDVSRQYVLGFEPASAADGRPHTLKVAVRDSRLKVRARTEYIANPR
jgi:VWFA-related protein